MGFLRYVLFVEPPVRTAPPRLGSKKIRTANGDDFDSVTLNLLRTVMTDEDIVNYGHLYTEACSQNGGLPGIPRAVAALDEVSTPFPRQQYI